MKINSVFLDRTLTAAMLSFLAIISFLVLSKHSISLIIGIVSAYILIIEWPQFNQWWLTPLYPIASMICTIALNEQTNLLPLVILIVAMSDTGAYIGGKLFGTHRMAPIISPKKTWEGLIAGLVASMVSGIIGANYFNFPVNAPLIIWIVCISIASTLGDLFESYLKRKAHIKDSGTSLPGHGGVLDRVDSLLFAAPMAYIFYLMSGL